MENFYGGRRGPKGDSLVEITLDNYGKLKYKVNSYVTADEEGVKTSEYINAGDIKYVESINVNDDGEIIYTYNYYNEGTDVKHTETDSEWEFPADRVTYTDLTVTPNKSTNVKDYLESLDYSATIDNSKTITSISETDGKIAVGTSDISIKSNQINDKTDDYNETGTGVTTGKAIKAALDTLDVTGTSAFGAGKTIAAWSETNGKVSITSQDISIIASQISNGADTFASKEQGTAADTAVQVIKITEAGTNLKDGTTVILPFIPSTAEDVGALPKNTKIPTIEDTYNPSSSNGASGKAVASALGTLTIPSITNTYSSTSESGMSGKAVASALGTLTIPSITNTYSSTSESGMSGKAVASALAGFISIYSSSDWTSLEEKPTDKICLIYAADGESQLYYKPSTSTE